MDLKLGCSLGTILILLSACAEKKFYSSSADSFQSASQTEVASDFTCTSIQILPLTAQLDIPSRDSSGLCYAVQLASAISLSPSSLTKVHDADVLAADQTQSPYRSGAPFVLAKVEFNLIMQGARKIKLAGAPDVNTPIKVDNFLLFGLANAGRPITAGNFRAWGTSDAAVPNSLPNIQFRGGNVSVEPFASGHTATIQSLDLTDQVVAKNNYAVDIRAEDCGGERELSDLFLIFE